MLILPSQISYCSNVHSGESLEEVKLNISSYIHPIRIIRGLDTMDMGLWLSAAAAKELRDLDKLKLFKRDLNSANLRLTSINGFPYGGFHQAVVKKHVYTPDWSESARLEYSQNLAIILAECLPDDCRFGVISTLPLGYKEYWNDDKQRLAVNNLGELSLFLKQLKQKTGKHIQVCLEMEPDCVLESSNELIDLFSVLSKYIPQFKEHIGVCYDVCHQAVMYEDAYKTLSRICSEKIFIGKIQISNALEVCIERDDIELLTILNLLCEKKYLHQVKYLSPHNQLLSKKDFSEALADESLKGNCRVHFHVPIDVTTMLHPLLNTTQTHLQDVFDFLKDNPFIRPYLEVETYSWHVLPKHICPQNDTELVAGIVAELFWVEAELSKRGLLQHE